MPSYFGCTTTINKYCVNHFGYRQKILINIKMVFIECLITRDQAAFQAISDVITEAAFAYGKQTLDNQKLMVELNPGPSLNYL